MMRPYILPGRVVGVCLALFFILFSLKVHAGPAKSFADKDLKHLASHIHWLGHSTFRIEDKGLIIYVDPFRLQTGIPKADLILITHDHFDHASPADVGKIQKSGTIIITAAKAANKFAGDVRILKPGGKIVVQGIGIQAVPAYNINKFRSPGVPFHPEEQGYVGYILMVGGLAVYHAGDTDFIPEMKGIQADVALLPVTGTYVMNAEEAAGAAAAIRPKLAIPMHVGGPIGSLKSAEDFKAKSSVPAIILPIER